jgi:2-phospho-L-lactate guanylyltransferase
MHLLAAVPVKRFFVAKRRLSPILDAPARALLGRDLAAHTISTVEKAGLDVVALAADDEVAAWAAEHGWRAVVDSGRGLDAAAREATILATEESRPWMIVHADLPLVTPDDILAAARALAEGGSPIAPSDDGGTSLIGGRGPFSFSYGRASFHRHLARAEQPVVIVRRGLALDLDGPGDFDAAADLPEGRWLRRYGP